MFDKKLEIAQQAVLESMRLCKTIQMEMTGKNEITKSDKSPVTTADFTSQAIICKMLDLRFPNIPIVGEERSDALRKPENSAIVDNVFHYIESNEHTREFLNRENLFECIDLGDGEPNETEFWTVDPVDGTKGFLRGEQFAVALALIVNGQVKLGVLGCPNMEIPGDISKHGYLLYAVRGSGAFLLNIESNITRKISISTITNPEKMRFVESYEASHSNLEMQLEIARRLNLSGEPVQMDSQVKYGVLASGNGEIYLRIPNPGSKDYKEKIWDHAAGSIIVQEAGGIASDIYGKPLDFKAGKTLKNNTGILASVPSIHNRIVELVKELS